MRVLWVAVLICAGAVLLLAFAPPDDIPRDSLNTTRTDTGFLNGSPESMADGLFSPHEEPDNGIKTAIFSKQVAPDTAYLVVSLYSGDTTDPISVTIITPDRTLGPYYDATDGSVDGRIDLKISNPDSMTPGLWKFLVHSRKNISYGSLENLSWIRTGTDDHKADE
jgi:hypothetical protein